MTALVMHPAPIVATFHAAGDSTVVPAAQPARARASPTASTCAAPCRTTPRRWPSGTSAAHYEVLFNGIELERFRARRAAQGRRARRSSSAAATSPARASTCCSRPCAAARRSVRLLGRQRRPGHGPAPGAATPATPASSGSAGSPTTRRSPGCAVPRVLRPVAPGRVVRRGAARGDGRGHADRGHRTSPATATWPGPSWTPCWPRPAMPTRSPTACGAVLADDDLAAGLRRPGAARAAEFSMDRLARATRSATSSCCQEPRCRRHREAAGPPYDAEVSRPVPAEQAGTADFEGTAMTVVLIIILVLVVLAGGVRDRHLQRADLVCATGSRTPGRRSTCSSSAASTSSPTSSRPSRATPPTSARRSTPSSRPATQAIAAQGPQQEAQADNDLLTGALRQLFALSEAYPDLKANQNFSDAAGGADGHRGPGRLRAAVLQRHRPEVQHQDPAVPRRRCWLGR